MELPFRSVACWLWQHSALPPVNLKLGKRLQVLHCNSAASQQMAAKQKVIPLQPRRLKTPSDLSSLCRMAEGLAGHIVALAQGRSSVEIASGLASPLDTARARPARPCLVLSPVILALLAGCAHQAPNQLPSSTALPPGIKPTAEGRGCKSLGPSKQQASAVGAVVGGLLGAVIGSETSRRGSVGARNGLLLGALAGGLVGSQMGSSIKTVELEDGSVRLDIPGSVLFASGSATVSDGFKSTLERVGKTILEYCGLTAQVIGHTDSLGRPADNKTLSVNRARSVVNQLVAIGVPEVRLSFDGIGPDRPVADNTSDSGRQQNRRVEIFVRPPVN